MVGPNLALWEQIRDFDIDDVTAKLPFSARLARENSWSVPYAQRVIEEYKRFIFLAMVARHEVTPSDEVDQAWHLHLVYTRSYWDKLCGRILLRPLHHEPTRGGDSERGRFGDNYQQTLQSYQQWFSESPLADIWPPSASRFNPRLRHVRVNLEANWIIDKRAVKRRVAALVVVGCALTGLGAAGPLAASDFAGFVIAMAVIIAVVAFITLIVMAFRKRGDHTSGSGGCGGAIACGTSSIAGGDCDGSASGGDSGCGGGGCGGGCGGGGCGSS